MREFDMCRKSNLQLIDSYFEMHVKLIVWFVFHVSCL